MWAAGAAIPSGRTVPRASREAEVVVSDTGPGSEQTPHPYDVEVQVVAEPVHLSVIRAVVADLAMRRDFDLDAIADLRMAVDEACSTLIRIASPGAILHCGFRAGPDEIEVSASVVTSDGACPHTNTFGWRVLTELSDSASTRTRPSATHEGTRVFIDLVKKRGRGVDG